MKNKIQFILIVSALLFLAQDLSAQSNKYVWLHGLNDNSDCWLLYSNDFELPYSRSYSHGYVSSRRTIASIADTLWKHFIYKENVVLIGHSMGGLVAREIEHKHSSKIKGIITIGTPHEGAPVVNEIMGRGLTLFGKNIVYKLTDAANSSLTAIIGTFLPVESSVYNFVEIQITPKIPFMISNMVIDDTVVPMAKNMVNTPCAQEMMVGSDYMNTIKKRTVQVPILSLATEEDRWQLARLGYCAANKTLLQQDSAINIEGKFDQKGYDLLNQVKSTGTVIRKTHVIANTTILALGWWNPSWWVKAARHNSSANKWNEFTTYLDNRLDYDHAALIGAYRIERRSDCRKILFWNRCQTRSYTISEPHDGVVPVSSQKLPSSRGKDVRYAKTNIKNVNHMEQFNHKNTREAFKKALVNGDFGEEFKR